mgnify:CR=1 FL=1
MNFLDLLKIGFGNLWQTKLRSILTILGVVIGIGALSSMISFGTGIQKNITDAFRDNELFNSMNITPAKISLDDLENPDPGRIREAMEEKKVPLNDSTLRLVKAIEGVAIAHPEVIIPGKLSLGGQSTTTRMQALPAEMGKYKPYNEMLAGEFISSDSGKHIILKWETLRDMGFIIRDQDRPYTLTKTDSLKGRRIIPADSLIGKEIQLISAKLDVEKIMSNPFALMSGKGTEKAFGEDSATFVITGILKRAGNFGSGNLKGGAVIPMKTASAIPSLGFTNIWDILNRDEEKNQYSSIYVRVDDIKDIDKVKEEIEKMGLHVFSITDELDQIKQAFLVMDSILGAIGVVALLIAALGIINTMVMSILERTREIGIMKAIGGSEAEIKSIFFVEAGAIGLIGAVFGLLLGWLFTLAANYVINNFVVPENELGMDLFYFPYWLILGSIAFALLLSLAAGLYPAARAARIDPVKALRHE